jgi:hypothetical protein
MSKQKANADTSGNNERIANLAAKVVAPTFQPWRVKGG